MEATKHRKIRFILLHGMLFQDEIQIHNKFFPCKHILLVLHSVLQTQNFA